MDCVFWRINRSASCAEKATFESNNRTALTRFRLFLLFLFLWQAARSQGGTDFVYNRYSLKDGLASNEIYKAQQDRDGYMWMATNNGLQRFDGTKFKTFRHEEGNPASLPSNAIHRLLIDKADRLWLATNKAEIVLFDKRRFTATQVPVRDTKPDLLAGGETVLTQDEDGRVFLYLRGHKLWMYDEKKQEFSTAASVVPLPKGWGVASIVQHPATRKYWVGIQGAGLGIYNPKTGKWSYYGHNAEHEPAVDLFGPKLEITYPLFDNRGRLWFERWNGGSPLCVQYDPRRQDSALKEFEFISRLRTYHELRGIIQQRDGRIWIRGYKLFGYFDEAQKNFVLIPNGGNTDRGIAYEELTSLAEDREANLWVGTNNNGLYRFNPAQQVFTNVYHPSRNRKGETGTGTVMSFVQLKNGNILAGTWEDALFQYTPDLKPLPLSPKLPAAFAGAYLWSMYASADSNTVWMGAQPGFWQYDQQKQTAVYHNPAPLHKYTVRQLVEDKAGTLWLGLHGIGLYRCPDPRNNKADSVTAVAEVGRSMVNKLMVDRKGWVWVGTGNNGLFVFEAAPVRLLHHFRGGLKGTATAPSFGICGLLDYNDSLVFVADDSRLYSYNRNTHTLRLRVFTGSFAGTISSLEKDAEGYIWIGTSNALYRVHPGSKTALVFNRLDGIGNDHFVLSSTYRLRDGRLLFGTSNSFVAFDPKRAGVLPSSPTIHITGIRVGNRELLTDSALRQKHLELDAKTNTLTVDFSPLEYNAIYPIQYMMESIDKDWRFADQTARITYPFLPTGRHKLLLRTYTPEGKPSSVTELRLYVKPPWYQTWWFYTLVAVAFIIELWWLDRQRTRRKEVMQKVRTDIASNLHEEVNTALNNINILSEIARLKSDREPQKAKEYLEQIHNKSHNMIIAMDDMLWSLDPANDSMQKTIIRIREFADALTQRQGVQIELLIDKKVEKLELDMRQRHEAFLLFKEGLRSLVEAGTRYCRVHLAVERGKLFFTIEFANEGCNMQQLNNLLQRHDMALRIQALKAKLDVHVHKSRSVFSLQLPLGGK